ncbi:MAG: glycosyltransferase family 9 protein [Campylobacterales bacterium]|nr:glycosyltransferase family 9 protein [Campylobacterales bacterium]
MNLLNKFFDSRSYKHIKDFELSTDDFKGSKKVLFAIFSRYGDFFGTLKVIGEFIGTYGDKQLLFLVPPQFECYVKYFFPASLCVCINKRNPFSILRALYQVKKFSPDIGLNPWCYGSESEFFISFAAKFSFFKKNRREKFANLENLYDKPRVYFGLETKTWFYIDDKHEKKYTSILVCPESSDVTRTISHEKLSVVLKELKSVFSPNEIIVAAPRQYFKDFDYGHKLILGRSVKSSNAFLSVMQNVDLVVSVDSGPLHLGYTLRKPLIGFFTKTPPEAVLDAGTKIKILRDNKFSNIHCVKGDRDCKYPLCMDAVTNDGFLSMTYVGGFQPSDINRVDACIY